LTEKTVDSVLTLPSPTVRLVEKWILERKYSLNDTLPEGSGKCDLYFNLPH